MTQAVEMKGERVWREVQGRCDRARRHALRPRLHEQPEHVEPIVLSESGERRDGVCFSIFPRLWNCKTSVNGYFGKD